MSRVGAGGSEGSLSPFVRPEESFSASEASSVLASVGHIGPILASEPSSSVAFVGPVVASESRSALASAVREDQVVTSVSISALASTIHQNRTLGSEGSYAFTSIAPVDIDLDPTPLIESTIDLVGNPIIPKGSNNNPETVRTSSRTVITIDSGATSVSNCTRNAKRNSTVDFNKNSTRNSTRSVKKL